MSATLDANILLYASDAQSPFHEAARRLVTRIAAGPEIVYLFWPTLMAYLRLATHPAVFQEPLPLTVALANVEQLLGRPHVRVGSEGTAFWQRFVAVASESSSTGNVVSDAHLAALVIEHEVTTIWTHNRDFRRFKAIKVLDPFESA